MTIRAVFIKILSRLEQWFSSISEALADDNHVLLGAGVYLSFSRRYGSVNYLTIGVLDVQNSFALSIAQTRYLVDSLKQIISSDSGGFVLKTDDGVLECTDRVDLVKIEFSTFPGGGRAFLRKDALLVALKKYDDRNP